MVLLTPALICNKDTAQGTQGTKCPLLGTFLAFAVSSWHKDDFHAGKGSINGAGVSNIIIPPVTDSFSFLYLSQCLLVTPWPLHRSTLCLGRWGRGRPRSAPSRGSWGRRSSVWTTNSWSWRRSRTASSCGQRRSPRPPSLPTSTAGGISLVWIRRELINYKLQSSSALPTS